MRTRRILSPGTAHYHVMSRVVDGQFIFRDAEKARFRQIMRGLEHFMGVRVLTYCLMSNHFHILLEVPDEEELALAESVSDEELVRLIAPLYGSAAAEALRMELRNCDDWGFDEKKARIRDGYLGRRGRLDLFMKDLKQRFSCWYNKRAGRRGTLWEDRFKSVLVGDSEEALLAMAAYIDLNPVRAGMVDDPADYRFSGYGEAVAGGRLARRGLALALEQRREAADWRMVGREYRKLLYGVGVEKGLREDGTAVKAGFSRAEALAEMKRGGTLPLWKLLRCRVRYMTDGAVFGSARFVEGVFESQRERFAERRTTGVRRPKGGTWGDLAVLRDLRQEVFG